jgi:hypothetical protein
MTDGPSTLINYESINRLSTSHKCFLRTMQCIVKKGKGGVGNNVPILALRRLYVSDEKNIIYVNIRQTRDKSALLFCSQVPYRPVSSRAKKAGHHALNLLRRSRAAIYKSLIVTGALEQYGTTEEEEGSRAAKSL